MNCMSEYQKSQMSPGVFEWLFSLVIVAVVLGLFGSMDLETQQVAAAHQSETIAAMQAEAKEKQDIEVQKIALYEKGQYMTGFGGMKLAVK